MQPPPAITVDSIPDDGLNLTLALDPAWLTEVLSDAGMKPVEGTHPGAQLRLDRDGSDVIVSGTLKVRVVADCVACLEPVELPIAAEFQLVLEPASKAKAHKPGEEVELSPSELDADYYTDGTIQLSHWVREQLLLEAPVHPRHEGDCPRALTLTPTPVQNGGGERPVDPRLAPLLKLR